MKLKCSLCGTIYEFIYMKDEPLPSNFPFCSDRCKSIDLGKWLNEEYCISTPLPETEKITEMEQIFTEFHEEAFARLLRDDTESE